MSDSVEISSSDPSRLSNNDNIFLNIETSTNPTLRDENLYDWALIARFTFAINYVINPCIAVLGIVGNILSIIVLYRHGLDRSSSILLIALAVADTGHLTGIIHIPNFIYQSRLPQGFYFSRGVSWFFIVWCCVLDVISITGQCCSLTLPVLITIDRLIAVFFPLKRTTIVTARRTMAAIILLFSFWLVVGLYTVILSKFQESFVEYINVTIYKRNNDDLEKTINRQILIAVLHLQGTVPLIFVGVGCLIIGFKAKLILRKQMELTSTRETSGSRTTKMLLAVCGMYVVVCGYGWLFVYVGMLVPTLNPTLYMIRNLLLCLNGSWNFVIYVIMNKTFRKTYMDLILTIWPCRKIRRRSAGSSGAKTDLFKSSLAIAGPAMAVTSSPSPGQKVGGGSEF